MSNSMKKTAAEYLEGKHKEKAKAIGFRLRASLRDRLEKIAEERRLSISMIVVAAVEMYLDHLEKKK